ncbi:MAG TPA: phosphatase PAP2 family protein [Salinimicrobium sp.]|nr:phosphatase PAP2 family protein [Salinimicrobium sp.]
MEELIKLDHELFLFLNNLGNETWDWFWIALSGKFTAVPLYVLLLFLIYKNFGVKGTLITLVLVAGLITCTDQLANVFKDGFERLRPCRQEGVMEHARMLADYCGKYGYFSAHAASSTALAIYIGLILKDVYRKIIYFMIFWAILVSYSRIYVGVHYPGDVITGIVIGSFLGWIFYKLQHFLIKKYTDVGITEKEVF